MTAPASHGVVQGLALPAGFHFEPFLLENTSSQCWSGQNLMYHESQAVKSWAEVAANQLTCFPEVDGMRSESLGVICCKISHYDLLWG